MRQDIRWKQRLQNFKSAYEQFKLFMQKPDLNPFEEQGLIQCFEYNYELAWNVVKDFYESQGESDIQGSRDAFRLAIKRGLITEGEIWMEMIKARMQTSHTYNLETATKVIGEIRDVYFEEFGELIFHLESKD
jgi:nucleotidyltransferase substrate binding protein (TIGR01987 family)